MLLVTTTPTVFILIHYAWALLTNRFFLIILVWCWFKSWYHICIETSKMGMRTTLFMGEKKNSLQTTNHSLWDDLSNDKIGGISRLEICDKPRQCQQPEGIHECLCFFSAHFVAWLKLDFWSKCIGCWKFWIFDNNIWADVRILKVNVRSQRNTVWWLDTIRSAQTCQCDEQMYYKHVSVFHFLAYWHICWYQYTI